MVKTSHQELAETKVQPLPPATLEALIQMRNEMCIASKDFKLQESQRFLRRMMSPDSPTRGILLVHGAGSGKTCSAIQIAEEYVVRPEFQDKKVLVLANPAIQQNFKDQLFDVTRLKMEDGVLLSKQCSGRRYLEMVQRLQSEPVRLGDRESEARMATLAGRIIDEFYEFQGYQTLANKVMSPDSPDEALSDEEIHKQFDNRLLIIDEAHNLKETTETDASKMTAQAVERIIKTANGVILVLLTATPMYDTYDEILYYINLFLWNERKIKLNTAVKPSQIFKPDGSFVDGKEELFRGWCSEYISFLKGENPFTFPFRLPPPDEVVALPDRTEDITGNPIKTPLKYLTLTRSWMSPLQAEAVKQIKTIRPTTEPRTICVFPENKSFRETFEMVGGKLAYRGEQFLAPSKVPLYSSKFGLIMKILQNTKGLVFVYSNAVESGANLFAMCLEEHGYEPAIGEPILNETSGEVPKGSKGRYALFTSEVAKSDLSRTLMRLKSSSNADGSDIRVVIASPKVSEGVDFRYIRQVHILDPWFNMSRIEQVIGRGMRTCSHALLPFEDQNCTVYLHVCRDPNSKRESVDEQIYREFVESKAIKIAKVKRVLMESAMDCELQYNINNLPPDWRGQPDKDGQRFVIPQTRNQDGKKLLLTLTSMSAPTFDEGDYAITCKVVESEPDPEHERPLSAILDVKDEILDKLQKLFLKKPIWKRDQLFNHPSMKNYAPEVVTYTIQWAIDNGHKIRDRTGREGRIELKEDILSYVINCHNTIQERLFKASQGKAVPLPKGKVIEEEEAPLAEDVSLESFRKSYKFPEFASDFSKEVLDWHLIDIAMTKDERTNYLLNIDWTDPPIYAKNLVTTLANGTKLYIMGSKNIYNYAKEKITPIGAEEDAYRRWVRELKDRFIEMSGNILATSDDQVTKFNLDEKSKEIKRATRSKNIGKGRACSSFKEYTLNAFSEWLNGEPFPEAVKTKKDRCLYLDLLVRQAVLNGKEELSWVTPQEFEILSEHENSQDLIRRMKD
jgi:superfamily II DNA or RNA helicase